MASTFTASNGFEKQAYNSNPDTWGAPTLNDVLDRIDESLDGWVQFGPSSTTDGTIPIDVQGNVYNLPYKDLVIDDSPESIHRRGMKLMSDVFDDSPGPRVYNVPLVDKVWFVEVSNTFGPNEVPAFPTPDQFFDGSIWGYSFIRNSTGRIITLSRGLWIVVSRADGYLAAYNTVSSRAGAVMRMTGGGYVDATMNNLTIMCEAGTLTGSILLVPALFASQQDPRDVFRPGFSFTSVNIGDVDLVFDEPQSLEGVGPIFGKTSIPPLSSARCLWTGSEWYIT